MAGFPSFFEKRSSCSSSSRRILVPEIRPKAETTAPATRAKAATNNPLNINNSLVAGVAGSDKRIGIDSSVVLNESPGTATATTATGSLDGVAHVAAVADPTSYEPIYQRGSSRPVLTTEQVMSMPLRRCLDCFKFEIPGAYCKFYGQPMPDPIKPCRCRHFRLPD